VDAHAVFRRDDRGREGACVAGRRGHGKPHAASTWLSGRPDRLGDTWRIASAARSCGWTGGGSSFPACPAPGQPRSAIRAGRALPLERPDGAGNDTASAGGASIGIAGRQPPPPDKDGKAPVRCKIAAPARTGESCW